MKPPSRSLDGWLPVVFIAFALLAGATLWHEAASPSLHLSTAQG